MAEVSPRRPCKSQDRRLAFGNPGDVKPVGEGVSELRIHKGAAIASTSSSAEAFSFVLLCGGDKATQNKDIATAKRLAKETA